MRRKLSQMHKYRWPFGPPGPAQHGPVLGTARWSRVGTARQVQRAVPCQPTGGTNGQSTALKA